MISPLELSIAWRYLRGRGESRLLSFISLIAVCGVVVGVGALVVVMGVMNGLQEDLREKILVGSPDVRVLSYGEDLRLDGWKGLLGRVRRDPNVVAVGPFVLTQGVVTAGHGAPEGAYLSGLDSLRTGEPAPTPIRQRAVEGGFSFASSDGQGRGAVLGQFLAKRIGATLGDTVTVLTLARRAPEGAAGQPAPYYQERFEVTGLVRTGMYEYDNAYVFLSLRAAQEVAGLDSAVTGLEVRTTDRWVAPAVAHRLADSLGYPYRTVDWQEQNSTMFQALRLQKFGMTVVLLLIALVAAFTIVSNLTMVVNSKVREIGILRAMGMTAAGIRRVFLAQGLIIGAFGTAVGVVVGLGVSLLVGRYGLVKLDPSIYFIDHLPVSTSGMDVMLTVTASLAITALATISPAQSAARLYPVDAIRHE